MRSRTASYALVTFAGAALACEALAAPVYISHERRIGVGLGLANPDGGGGVHTTEAGPFNEVVTATGVARNGDGTDVGTVTMTAAIETMISDLGITASGRFTVTSDTSSNDFDTEAIGATYRHSARFTLLEPHRYTFSGSYPAGFGFRDDNAVMLFWNVNEDFEESVHFLGGENSSGSGILEPGEYQLSGFVSNFDDAFQIGENGVADFSTSLLFEPVTPIPLPAALWPGLAVLGAIVVKQMRKRRVAVV